MNYIVRIVIDRWCFLGLNPIFSPYLKSLLKGSIMHENWLIIN